MTLLHRLTLSRLGLTTDDLTIAVTIFLRVITQEADELFDMGENNAS